MIVYADTSTLAKLYLLEEGSAAMRNLVATASATTTSVVAYAETRVAMARAFRNGRLDERGLETARQKFEAEWPTTPTVEVSDEVLREAGDLGDRHPIRGFDAIHLASAKQVRSLGKDEIVFSTADQRLRDAAIAEGFSV